MGSGREVTAEVRDESGHAVQRKRELACVVA